MYIDECGKQCESMNEFRRETYFRLLLVSYIVIAVWVASLNEWVFPLPLDDEARFYLPALWWAQHLNLSPTNVNAPQGIFWVPDGFTIFVGVVLRIFGTSFVVAKHFIQLCGALGVALLALAARVWTGSRRTGAAVLLCGVSPIAIYSMNSVRMEAVLLLFFGLAALLHALGKHLHAASVLFLTILFHPAGIMAAIAYSAVTLTVWLSSPKLSSPNKKGMSWTQLTLPAIVVTLAILETIHFVNHHELYAAQLKFQYARKAGRPLLRLLAQKPAAILALFSVPTLIGMYLRRKSPLRSQANVWAWLSLAFGVGIYSVLGAEVAYQTYMLFLCPVLLMISWYRMLLELREGHGIPGNTRA